MDTSLTEVKDSIINFIAQATETKQIAPLIKDGLDIVGTTSTAFEVVRNVSLYLKLRKSDALWKGLYNGVHNKEPATALNSKELGEFFNDPANLEHISQIIDASLNSQSIKCSEILGYYAGGLLSQKIDLKYRDSIIVNALKVMNDRDLFNFIQLYRFVKSRPDLLDTHNKSQLRTYDIQKDLASLNIPLFELELTIEKLKSVQAIGYAIGGWGSAGNAWGTFKFNENSDYLFELASKFLDLIDLRPHV